MKLGGWHRIWIVASTTYFVLVSAFVFLNWLQPEGLPHTPDLYEQLAPESSSKIVPSSKLDEIDSREGVLRVKMPSAHVIPFYSEYSQDELEKVTDEYWSVARVSYLWNEYYANNTTATCFFNEKWRAASMGCCIH
jgi:hypothetical protein